MHDVFISYSEKDHDRVENIRRTLEANGITCWFAPIDIRGNQHFTEVIPQAIRDSRAFLLLMSPGAQDSKWVKRELGIADDLDKPIYTLFLEDCPLNDHFDFVLHFNQHYHASLGEETQLSRLITDLKKELELDNSEPVVKLPLKKPEKKSKKWLIPVITVVCVIAIALTAVFIFAPEKEIEKPTNPNGTYIIWNPTYNMALSAKEKNTHYLAGEQLMFKNGDITNYSDVLKWDVKFIEGDVITISHSGKKLGMQEGYNGIGLDDKYSLKNWKLIKKDDGTYLIKNADCDFYLEWFVEKNNWSTHDKVNSSNEDQFLLKLEKVA
jgi:hypothetical protein